MDDDDDDWGDYDHGQAEHAVWSLWFLVAGGLYVALWLSLIFSLNGVADYEGTRSGRAYVQPTEEPE